MTESWSTRWYTPLLALAGALVVVLVLALAFVQVLTADTPVQVAPQAWNTPLEQLNDALARGDDAGAMRAWSEARSAAIRSAHWEGLLAVGDASRRFGVAGRARARQAYLTALFRARRERSLDGLLEAARGFGELGDHDVLTYALRIAEREAGRDPIKRTRVRSVTARWTSPSPQSEHRDSTLTGGDHP